MGKKIIIKGADFSKNGFLQVSVNEDWLYNVSYIKNGTSKPNLQAAGNNVVVKFIPVDKRISTLNVKNLSKERLDITIISLKDGTYSYSDFLLSGNQIEHSLQLDAPEQIAIQCNYGYSDEIKSKLTSLSLNSNQTSPELNKIMNSSLSIFMC